MTIITLVSPFMVRATGLEPACLATYEHKSYVSANSTTPAYEQPEDTFDCYLFY